MPRWDPQAEERLRTAAIELFLERGYEHVTVAQITDRAGLTRRTFSRYFADKRDVLFAGADELPGMLAAAVIRADASLGPYDAVLAALAEVGALLGEQVGQLAEQRQQVIARSPELQERGRTKFAAVADAIAGALQERGVATAVASLHADVGVAVFRSGFVRWSADPASVDLPTCIREAGAEVVAAATDGRT